MAKRQLIRRLFHHQLRTYELRDRLDERLVVQVCQRTEQGIIKAPADDGSKHERLLCLLAQALDALPYGVLHAARNAQSAERFAVPATRPIKDVALSN